VIPGDSVTVRYTKWDGTPHWRFPAEYLGEDRFGRWVGGRPGIVFDRPGLRLDVHRNFVVLFPQERGFTPCFHQALDTTDDVARFALYTDITTVPRWIETEREIGVTMVDLDLDIIKLWDGTVFVDDEDEFAEHQVAMAYPAGVTAQAEADCQHVFAAVRGNAEPYATVGQSWLDAFIASNG